MGISSSTPLTDRLAAIREKRDAPHPSKFASMPTGESPMVRMARRGELRPSAIGGCPTGCSCGGAA